MKTTFKALVLGLALAGAAVPAIAQPYGYGRDRDYGDDDRGPRDRDYGDRRGYGRGGYDGGDRGGYGRGGFDAAEYVRCNPDVRRALRNGQLTSAWDHYRVFGRREGRRLSC